MSWSKDNQPQKRYSFVTGKLEDVQRESLPVDDSKREAEPVGDSVRATLDGLRGTVKNIGQKLALERNWINRVTLEQREKTARHKEKLIEELKEIGRLVAWFTLFDVMLNGQNESARGRAAVEMMTRAGDPAERTQTIQLKKAKPDGERLRRMLLEAEKAAGLVVNVGDKGRSEEAAKPERKPESTNLFDLDGREESG